MKDDRKKEGGAKRFFLGIVDAVRHPKAFLFCLKYPFWKSYNVWDGRFLGYSFTAYEEMPSGWRKAFGKQMSKDIKEAGKKTRKRYKAKEKPKPSWKDMLFWHQIKEKYGELRLYASASEEIQEVLDRYELLSIGYCINCGSPARYVTDGWVEYLCEDCAERIIKPELLKESRLTEKDIPHLLNYDDDGKTTELNIKERYGVDLPKLWGLEEKE